MFVLRVNIYSMTDEVNFFVSEGKFQAKFLAYSKRFRIFVNANLKLHTMKPHLRVALSARCFGTPAEGGEKIGLSRSPLPIRFIP